MLQRVFQSFQSFTSKQDKRTAFWLAAESRPGKNVKREKEKQMQSVNSLLTAENRMAYE
jgi:hypothetical protein